MATYLFIAGTFSIKNGTFQKFFSLKAKAYPHSSAPFSKCKSVPIKTTENMAHFNSCFTLHYEKNLPGMWLHHIKYQMMEGEP